MTDQENLPEETLESPVLNPITPVVLKTKKKKKYKYSRGLKSFQLTGRRMTKVSSHVVRSVAKGMETFRKESAKSAAKKRDGAIRDFGLNTAKSMSKSLRYSSRIPLDLAKAFDRRSSRKRIRRQIKGAARMARLMRIR